MTIPILTYHAVDPAGLESRHLLPEERIYSIGADLFEDQLRFLAENGFRSLTVDEVVGLSERAEHGPERAVCLTFDDGNLSDYSVVYPLLHKYGMTGTFFVVTSTVGQPGHVTWQQLSEMRAHGCSVQSHSCTHPFLSRCSAEDVHRELEDSKAAIEDSLGAPVSCFALPGGDSHPQLRRLVRAAGYRALCTSRPGVNRRIELFRLERLSVRKGDPLRRFIGLVTLRPLSLAANAFKTHVLDVLKATLGLDHYLQLKRWVLGTEPPAELTGSRCRRW